VTADPGWRLSDALAIIGVADMIIRF